MITKNDAIIIAQTLAKAAKFDIDNHCLKENSEHQIPAIRGVVFRALGDIYYEIVPEKVRESFRKDSEFASRTGCEQFLLHAREILDPK